MPLIGVATKGVDFSNVFLALDGADYASLKAAKDAGGPVMTVGLFINAIINFLIVSFVIFFLVKGVNRLRRQEAASPTEPSAPPQDIALLTEIRDLLKK